jgi:GNAT superfamily N-acetyltransferase
MSEILIVDRAPTIGEYRALCTAVGWATILNFEAVPAALATSLTACVALADDRVVGMARLVGDGSIYFYVQDVAVLPTHQGSGVGALLLRRLLTWLAANAPERAFVGLFAASGTEAFYRREGFAAHDGLVGMFRLTPVMLDER